MNEKLLIFRIILLDETVAKPIPLMLQQCRTVNNKFICSAGFNNKTKEWEHKITKNLYYVQISIMEKLIVNLVTVKWAKETKQCGNSFKD